MRRAALSALPVIALLGAACDPTYSLHLRARITEQGKPLTGAWIIVPDGARLEVGAVRTDQDGAVDVRLRAFLRNLAGEPLAVARGADEIALFVPGKDFPSRKTGFFGHEWESVMEVAFQPQRPGFSLRCEAARCTLAGVDPACELYEISFEPERPEGHGVALSGLGFVRRNAAGPTVVVAICSEKGALRPLVSNAAP
jgi:hypothetical protein